MLVTTEHPDSAGSASSSCSIELNGISPDEASSLLTALTQRLRQEDQADMRRLCSEPVLRRITGGLQGFSCSIVPDVSIRLRVPFTGVEIELRLPDGGCNL